MERYTKTGLNVRQDIFLKLKLLATARGKSFTEVLNEMLDECLKMHEEEIREITENMK